MRFREWSIRRWMVTAVVVLLALVGVRVQMKLRLRHAIEELRAAGKPTRYEDLNRLQGQIEGAPNMVAALTNAIGKLPELDPQTSKLLPVRGEARTPPAGEPWPTDVAEVTRHYLETNRSVLEEVRVALSTTNAWWWGDYDPEKWDINGISKSKAAAANLSLAAAFGGAEGDIDGALEDVRLIFLISERMYRDPTLIAHLVRSAVQAIGTQRTAYVLECGEPSPAVISRLRDSLRVQLSQVSLAHVHDCERVYFLEPAYYRSQRMLFGAAMTLPEEGSLEDYKQQAMVLGYRVCGLADRDILYAIETFDEIVSRVGTIEGLVELEQNASQLLPSSRGRAYCFWSEQAFSMGPTYLKRYINGITSTRAVDAALAVTEYRLRHAGELPASLEALVPEYLEAVPIEPRSGEPFELIVTEDGYGIGRETPVFKVKLKQL